MFLKDLVPGQRFRFVDAEGAFASIVFMMTDKKRFKVYPDGTYFCIDETTENERVKIVSYEKIMEDNK